MFCPVNICRTIIACQHFGVRLAAVGTLNVIAPVWDLCATAKGAYRDKNSSISSHALCDLIILTYYYPEYWCESIFNYYFLLYTRMCSIMLENVSSFYNYFMVFSGKTIRILINNTKLRINSIGYILFIFSMERRLFINKHKSRNFMFGISCSSHFVWVGKQREGWNALWRLGPLALRRDGTPLFIFMVNSRLNDAFIFMLV